MMRKLLFSLLKPFVMKFRNDYAQLSKIRRAHEQVEDITFTVIVSSLGANPQNTLKFHGNYLTTISANIRHNIRMVQIDSIIG